MEIMCVYVPGIILRNATATQSAGEEEFHASPYDHVLLDADPYVELFDRFRQRIVLAIHACSALHQHAVLIRHELRFLGQVVDVVLERHEGRLQRHPQLLALARRLRFRVDLGLQAVDHGFPRGRVRVRQAPCQLLELALESTELFCFHLDLLVLPLDLGLELPDEAVLPGQLIVHRLQRRRDGQVILLYVEDVHADAGDVVVELRRHRVLLLHEFPQLGDVRNCRVRRLLLQRDLLFQLRQNSVLELMDLCRLSQVHFICFLQNHSNLILWIKSIERLRSAAAKSQREKGRGDT